MIGIKEDFAESGKQQSEEKTETIIWLAYLVIIKLILAVLKNICQRELFVWYHRYKKCRIYETCDVSQTPIETANLKGE